MLNVGYLNISFSSDGALWIALNNARVLVWQFIAQNSLFHTKYATLCTRRHLRLTGGADIVTNQALPVRDDAVIRP